MKDEQIRRINELAKKSRECGLSPAEKEEQAALRAEYVAAIRGNLTATLDNLVTVDENGREGKLKRRHPVQ